MGGALTRYHISLDVADRPGVLAQVALAFAEHGVSIETVRQQQLPARDGEQVDVRAGQQPAGGRAALVVVTHTAPDAALAATVAGTRRARRRRGRGQRDASGGRALMAHQWRGVIEEYRDRLPVDEHTPVVTLREGGTPLVRAQRAVRAHRVRGLAEVRGGQPDRVVQGPRDDHGDLQGRGGRAPRPSSAPRPGNTSASAAAYAAAAGMTCAVLVPDGKIAMGKLSQAIAHGARLLQVDGNFDDCLTLARKLAEAYPVELVNSVNPARIEGQKTAAFEIVDVLGDAPDVHCLPVGNAGNITAYWLGYTQYAATGEGATLSASGLPGPATRRPRMWGFQAAGAAPIVLGHPVDHPETIATAIRIGNPASWQQAVAARDASGGLIDAVTDEQILSAHRLLSASEGVFVEPASAASVAGLLAGHEAGLLDPGQVVVCTVTGHGLKDPQWAIRELDGRPVEPQRISVDALAAARSLGLEA